MHHTAWLAAVIHISLDIQWQDYVQYFLQVSDLQIGQISLAQVITGCSNILY